MTIEDNKTVGAVDFNVGSIEELSMWTSVLTLPRLTRASNWKTPEGALIKISEMSKPHLQKTITMLKQWKPSVAPADELRKAWLKVMETEVAKR
jgi:hypothetical protein